MQKVLQFLIKRFNFIFFLFLEVLAFSLIFSNNAYQGSAYFNSSNQMAGNMISFSNGINDYIHLKEVNHQLVTENAKLRKLITIKSLAADKSVAGNKDSVYAKKYDFTAAKVINNSTHNFHNYITINKGLADSISPGMGVICPDGVVGKVKTCSRNFATITSVLHKEMLISSKLKHTNAIGTTRWEGIDARTARLLYIPRHIRVNKGDTVLASEFNSVFPEGELIGTVKSLTIKGDENFFNIDIQLATDFTSLSYVYVIKNKLKVQQDSLEVLNLNEKNEGK